MHRDLAYLIGAFLGDGCLSSAKRSASGKVFTLLSIDKDLVVRIQSILGEHFGCRLTVQVVKDRYYGVSTTRTSVIEFVEKHSGREKRWPDTVRDWSKESRFELLAGLLDTDGYTAYQKNKLIKGQYYDQCRIGFCSTSAWILEVKRLAEDLGIRVGKVCVASNGKKYGHRGEKVVWTINLRVRDFVDVGAVFHVARKQARVLRYVEKYALEYPHRPYADYCHMMVA